METRSYSWVALDKGSCHPTESAENSGNKWCSDFNRGVEQEADQVVESSQSSNEVIIIRDSCDIEVSTTETQVAASLQAALQVGIALVINLTIADSQRAETVTQELLQRASFRQAQNQKLIIENSRNVDVSTTDTEVALSLQALLQILIALVVSIGIL
ncbi:spore coat protein [Metabacillus sp. GX 13764]|uniref:spore coat protein n=1 Tax=Metabacillus kandeliae TaxID=2900151 RepID=UPI001E534D55|nr:spore coat protein [Metabacillus kandeliae]MCD7034998.1 spore coat protein [Metabacillus kandeliae]